MSACNHSAGFTEYPTEGPVSRTMPCKAHPEVGGGLRGRRTKSTVALACLVLPGSSIAQGYPLLDIPASAAGSPQQFGASVSAIPDVNGDGVPDVLVGAPASSVGGAPTVGTVHVFSGSSGALIYSVVGGSGYDRFGFSLAAVSDMNADTIPDFVVGAPHDLGPPATPGAGLATVCSGADGLPLLLLPGTAVGERFGYDVAGMPDLTGDGVPEIVVSAPFADFPSAADAGEVRVFSGASGVLVFACAGLQASESLGLSIVAGIDFNADGIPDLAAGAPYSSPAGRVALFSGVSGQPLGGFTSPVAGEQFGSSLDSGIDADADGVPDLIVGIPNANSPLTPPCCAGGQTRVVSTSTGTVLHLAGGTALSQSFGSRVVFCGDLNADGIGDYCASGIGPARLLSGVDSTTLLNVFSSSSTFNPPPWLVLGGAADFNADGALDIVVGDPAAPPFPNGRARVISFVGLPPGAAVFGTACVSPGGTGTTPPTIQGAGNWPMLSTPPWGGAFQVALLEAPPNTTAILVAGPSSQVWLGIPLPIALSIFGLTGCALNVAADVFLLRTTSPVGPAQGQCFLSFPIPADPGLVGGQVYFQWYVVDPGPGLLPGSMTTGLRVQIL